MERQPAGRAGGVCRHQRHHHRGSWGQSQVDLGAYAGAGDTIVLRFDFGTDGCNGQDGWYVDNVRVVMQPEERQGGTQNRSRPLKA